MNKFMGNCENRPGTAAGVVKRLVRLRRTAQIIAPEFIPGRISGENRITNPGRLL